MMVWNDKNGSPVEFVKKVNELKADGKKEKDISSAMGFATVHGYRLALSEAHRINHISEVGAYKALKEAGYSRMDIRMILGVSESTMLCFDKENDG